MTTTEDITTTTPGGLPGDVFGSVFGRVSSVLDELVEVPAWSLSEAVVLDRLGEALGLRARVEEITVRLLASVAEREVPLASGASSTRGWLMGTHRLSGPDAARLVREAAVHAGDAPATADAARRGAGMADSRVGATRAAWTLGLVSAEQALLIASTIRKVSDGVEPARLMALQSDLVGHAQTLSFDALRMVCRHAVEVVDPDGADARLADGLEREEKRALAGAELSFRRSGDGWTGFSGRLPDSYAELWRKTLDAYTNPRHHTANPAAARDAAGSEQLAFPPAGWDQAGPGCPRRHDPDPESCATADPARGIDGADRKAVPYQQRLGRAWCELLEHLPVDGLPRHGANTTTVVITIGLDQLKAGVGEAITDTGSPMSPGQVRRLACNAAILPIVLDGDSKILDLGMSRRLFDRYQRIALAVRDGGCIWPACDRSPAWCEAHHVTSWADGGPTDLTNGCLLCSFHHHLVHSGEGWQVQMGPDGFPEVLTPPRLDPDQTPRRHQRLTHLTRRRT